MKSIKKTMAMLLAVCMMVTLVPGQAEAASVKVKKIAVQSSLSGSSKTVVVAKGKSVKLKTTVTVTPNKSKNKGVTYKSANKKIATVSSKGVVKGVKAGSTKITVVSKKDKKKKATINVKVKEGTVTKVKLDSTSGTINIGQSVKVKATVTGKKGCDKTVAWSSSNAKVATVDSKGNVVGVAEGSATITAKAIDGSGKKATYKVKVENPFNLTSVSVLNAQTVSFTLDRPCTTLSAANVVIKKKGFAAGTYQYTCTLDNLSTADGVNYTAVLIGNDRLNINDYVQVNIPVDYGTVTSMEACFTEAACAFVDDSILTYNIDSNNEISDEIYARGYGYSSITMTGGDLPAGANIRYKNGDAYLSGTLTTPGVYTAVFSCVDELGNTYTINRIYLVGSNTSVQAAAKTVYCLTDDSRNSRIYAVGGSGEYNYTIQGAALGTKIVYYYDSYEDEYTYGVNGEFAAPGTYSISVSVVDEENSALAATATSVFNVQQACVVSGVLADANGNAISDANEYISVKFINKNRADRYGREWTWASVDSKGAISATLPAGTYDVEASYTCGVTEATKYLYNVVIDTTKSGFDIKLPLYKFTVYSGEEGVLKNFGNWNDVYGDTYAYGNTIYLKEGTYNLTYKYGDDNRWGDSTGKDWLTASVSVTVPSASAQSFVTAQIN